MAKYFKIPHNELFLFVYMWKPISVYIGTINYITQKDVHKPKYRMIWGRKWNISSHEADHIWPCYRTMVFPQVKIKIASKTKGLNINTF